MNARQFVAQFQKLVKQGQSLKAGTISSGARPKIPASTPKVLIFSPHPDDECITGGLALRLLREAKWNVINVAVTLGSNRARRAARRRELQSLRVARFLASCAWRCADWEDIHPAARRKIPRPGGRR